MRARSRRPGPLGVAALCADRCACVTAYVSARRARPQLAETQDSQGTHFRRQHAGSIHMALDILLRNTGRDTRGHEAESGEKAALSEGAIEFLRASSFNWPEAQELMSTRDAIEA